MSDYKSLFAEGVPRGLAKVAWIAGLVMVIFAVAIYIRVVSANNSSLFDKVPAVITTITPHKLDPSLQQAAYEYTLGNEVIKKSIAFPLTESKNFKVGGKIMLLRDLETGEIIFADSGDAVGAFSLKLGFIGMVILIAAIVFLRRNPAPK